MTTRQRPLLRHKVQLQAKTVTQSGTGQPVESWGTVDTVWAAVEPVSGREFFAAAAVWAETTFKVTVRYRPDITPLNRIIHDGKLLDIQAVLNVEGKGRYLEIVCRALE